MVISIDAEKAFDKTQHLFKIKNSVNKLGVERTHVNLIKVICDTANITLNSEKLKASPLGSETGECPPSPLLFSTGSPSQSN